MTRTGATRDERPPSARAPASAPAGGGAVTLLALLAIGAIASAGSAWGLARGGNAARAGAMGGVLALALIAVLAAASPTTNSLTPDESGAVPGTLWNGALAPGGYFRVVIALWAVTSLALAAAAWLLRGTAGLRGLLPGTLAALAGGAVALTATTPTLGVVAAAGTGLASVPVILATPRAAAAGVAAREVRIAVATAAVVLAVATVAPVLSRLVLANPDVTSAADSGLAAAVAFGLLVMALVLAARMGAIPYHVRVSALTDVAPAGALPLVIAWLPLPMAAAVLGVATGTLVPMALPVGSARALIVALTLLATIAAALVAFLQDDLRHAAGYVTIADLGLVVLALAALAPEAWGPARIWLLTVAVTKTALAAWATVVEDRYETRAVPDLRGWLRRSPVLGAALVLTVLATYGLPGWAVLGARGDLARVAAGGPWDTLLLIASWLTLPAYLRWLWLGLGAPTSHVDRAVPEFAGVRLGWLPTRRLAIRPPARRRDAVLPVEQEGDAFPALGPSAIADAGTAGRADADPATEPGTGVSTRSRRGRRGAPPDAMALGAPASSAPVAAGDIETPADRSHTRRRDSGGSGPRIEERLERHRTGLLSGVVLALALLASLVAMGAFNVAAVAQEHSPAVMDSRTAVTVPGRSTPRALPVAPRSIVLPATRPAPAPSGRPRARS